MRWMASVSSPRRTCVSCRNTASNSPSNRASSERIRLRKLDWAPRSVHRKARAAAVALREVEARRGGEATEADVAAQMGVSLHEYQHIVQDALGCQLLRLNDAEDGEDSTLDRLPDNALDPQGMALVDSLRPAIIDRLQELPERERLVLSMYYEQELNFNEICVVLKITDSRVGELHGQALLRLKSRLGEWQT